MAELAGAAIAGTVAGVAVTLLVVNGGGGGMSAGQAVEIVTTSGVYKARGTVTDAARSVLVGLPAGYVDCKGLDPSLVLPGERILTEHLDLLPPEHVEDGWLVHCITGQYFVRESDGTVERR